MNNEMVNHPHHYNCGSIEVIDAIEDWGLGEGFNRGNAIKYIARAGKKSSATEIEDLEKARWYIDREIQRLREKEKRTTGWTCYKIGNKWCKLRNSNNMNEDAGFKESDNWDNEERVWENGVEVK